jgi:hypothetical protein
MPAEFLTRHAGASVPSYSVERESLDTEGIAFRMCSLWEVALEREKIAKLNGSS